MTQCSSRLRPALAGVAALACLAVPAGASTLDPVGDFLSIYVGPQAGDLDVVRVAARFAGPGKVRLTADHDGPIGATAGAAYVWGIDRGQGTERLAALTPSVGAGIPFDAVAVLFPDGTGFVADLVNGTPPATIDGADISIDGARISAVLSKALLPSTGFAFRDYAYNLWPRHAPGGVNGSDNTQISDLAPDAGTITAVPVPAALGLQLVGLTLLGWAAGRRRAALGRAAGMRRTDYPTPSGA